MCVYVYIHRTNKTNKTKQKLIKRMGPKVDEFCWFHDMKGASFRNFAAPALRLSFNIMRNRYPLRMGVLVVVNPPRFFKWSFEKNLILRWMSLEWRSKVCTHTHTHIHTHTCARTNARIHTHTHTHTYLCVVLHAYIHALSLF